ncbi:beta-keratin-related protein-like [Athene noctua]|uniref:beta-keratin-related protein-like n=2 Tax=Athene noctua TaxID=126797 RepID=UPI003EBDE934
MCQSIPEPGKTSQTLWVSDLNKPVGNDAKGRLPLRDMSCYSPCLPATCGPTPLANSCNEPCVIRCADSSVAIQPSPVVVTLPGPILSSFPQSTAVGSSASAAVGSSLSAASVPIASGGSLGLGGFGWSGLGRGLCGPLGRGNLLC